MQRKSARLLLVLFLGISNAVMSVRSGADQQTPQTLESLAHRAAAESKSAQMKLANIYLQGNGVAADIEKAIFYYRLAAEQDAAFAQYKLARLYLDGNRVKPDPEKAMDWMLRSARLGFIQAQLDLNLLYENGFGTPQNFVEAHKWLYIASSLTDSNLESRQKELEAKMAFTDLVRARLSARTCILKGYEGC